MNIAQELRRLADEIDKPDPYAEMKEAHAEGKVSISGPLVDCYSGEKCIIDNSGMIHALKPEPEWTLGRELPGFRALRDGEEWNFANTWKQEHLPAGKRPLLVGEPEVIGDEYLHGAVWKINDSESLLIRPKDMSNQRRTKRPLPILTPQQIEEGWIEWHGGENPAPGKRVNIIFRDYKRIDGVIANTARWNHAGTAGDVIAYRIIAPKLVQLGPEDVRCGDEVKKNGTSDISSIVSIMNHAVYLGYGGFITYKSLMQSCTIRRRTSETFEPCHKEAAQ